MHSLEYQARKLLGKNYGLGSLTVAKLLSTLHVIALFMASLGLRHINDMKTKHVFRFFEVMKDKGLSNTTLCGYATTMRKIAKRIGKPNIVPRSNADLGINRTDRYRPRKIDHGKADKLRERLYAKNRWQGLAYDMQLTFGLRLKESLLSWQTMEVGSDLFLIVKGAKGGRPRQLKITTEAERKILSQVHAHILQAGGKSLIPPTMTLKQAYYKQRNTFYRSEGTKKNNANSHLARHDRAQEMKKMGATDKAIAEYEGHTRSYSTKHYV